MSPAIPRTADERLLRLESEVLPLLQRVREAMTDPLSGPGREVIGRFLASAPVGVCVRLFETWQTAESGGDPVRVLEGRLSPENRFVLDLVNTIYSVPDAADIASHFPDYRHLTDS